ncbi:hypothetical protein ElyMa_002362600 [Elysia marginata]|uniref:Uncharacterized protein n=1 Tax=Elysia marginata TaxID=1093978 RepID=A0AAV4GD54_9GAST|nr:hypothetical protein ElyMa_002362600 [Elysia marginata]
MTSRVLHEIPLRLLHRKVGDERVTLLQACYDNPIFEDNGGKNFPASPAAAQNGNSAIATGAGGGKSGRSALGRKTPADFLEDGTQQDGRCGASYHVANDYMHSLPSKVGSAPDEIIFRTKRRRSRCKLLLIAFAATLVMSVIVVVVSHLKGDNSHEPPFSEETSTQPDGK